MPPPRRRLGARRVSIPRVVGYLQAVVDGLLEADSARVRAAEALLRAYGPPAAKPAAAQRAAKKILAAGPPGEE